jgi:hypothetical protein
MGRNNIQCTNYKRTKKTRLTFIFGPAKHSWQCTKGTHIAIRTICCVPQCQHTFTLLPCLLCRTPTSLQLQKGQHCTTDTFHVIVCFLTCPAGVVCTIIYDWVWCSSNSSTSSSCMHLMLKCTKRSFSPCKNNGTRTMVQEQRYKNSGKNKEDNNGTCKNTTTIDGHSNEKNYGNEWKFLRCDFAWSV